ncbi:MAG TPA: hypothetical protein VIF62_09790 [Labilithrix sp.]
MRRARWIALLATVVVACGIDAVGSLAPPAEDAGSDASLPPPPLPPEPPDADDGDSAIGVDAAEAGPKCGFVDVSDSLTTLDGGLDGGPDGGWVIVHDSSNGTYPQIDTSPEGPAVSLVGFGSSVGGIYLQPRALKAFDISFRYIVECPGAVGSCSDGLSAIWLRANDGGPPELYAPVSGATLGVPPGLDGGALTLDIATDPGPVDPATPAFSFLGIDGTKSPGSYDWHLDSGAPDAGFLGGHDVKLHVRKKTGVAIVDGRTELASTVPTNFDGWVGLVAASGGTSAVFYVRNFAARFYECDDP